MAHLAHVLLGIVTGAGAGFCFGIVLTLVAEMADVIPIEGHPLGCVRFFLALCSIPVGLVAGGIWGGVVAYGGGVGRVDDVLMLSARILGGAFVVMMVIIAVRVAAERPRSPFSSGFVVIAPPAEWRTERVRQRMVGKVQVFTYERHHIAAGTRTVDVSIYPEGEVVEAHAAGNALVLDDPDGVGLAVGHRASALQSETADVQLSYRASEHVLMRQDRVGALTVEFTYYPEPGPQQWRMPARPAR